ncbi:MAG: FAD-binding oxidoreductase [Burkholderiaceae bacterium]
MVTSWGRLGQWAHDVVPLTDRRRVASALRCAKPALAYGMGRSYGDACLNPNGVIWNTVGLDRFISFDAEQGILVCEAGVLLCEIQRLVVPLGWMLPVTPGTELITVGGAIANDVHGKNHHAMGSFGDHVMEMTLLRTDGEQRVCGPELNPQWFAATLGGIGLTGVILAAKLKLRRVAGPWLESETVPYSDLGEFFALADASEAAWEYTVSWIDCLSGERGRGLFFRANHAPAELQKTPTPLRTKSRSVPLVPPLSLVNRFSLRALNTAYRLANTWRSQRATVHYESYLYPLDHVLEWNRLYGPKGFYQYQSVLPRESGEDATKAMLKAIARSGQGSFLAVLKTFTRQSVGLLSFPRPGVTLALDFPNRGEATLKLFLELDAIVRDVRGRIYMAKDARMPRDLFESGYPRLPEFRGFRDPGISSAMSRRLLGS